MGNWQEFSRVIFEFVIKILNGGDRVGGHYDGLLVLWRGDGGHYRIYPNIIVSYHISGNTQSVVDVYALNILHGMLIRV